MKYIFSFLILMFLTACTNKAETTTTVNSEYKVDRLFSIDGCTVYRFYDSRDVYFTNCNGSTQTTVSCGKNCIRQENVD